MAPNVHHETPPLGFGVEAWPCLVRCGKTQPPSPGPRLLDLVFDLDLSRLTRCLKISTTRTYLFGMPNKMLKEINHRDLTYTRVDRVWS